MSIEIKIVGNSPAEIADTIALLAAQYGLAVQDTKPSSIDEVDLDTLVAATRARLEGEGFNMEVSEIQADLPLEPAKKSRKHKVSVEEAKKALEEEVDLPEVKTDEEVRDAAAQEALKKSTMKRLQDKFSEVGGKEIVNELLQKFGGDGCKSFREIPADKFSEIAKELGDE